MAELMASSAQSIKKEQKQAAPEPALAPAPWRTRRVGVVPVPRTALEVSWATWD